MGILIDCEKSDFEPRQRSKYLGWLTEHRSGESHSDRLQNQQRGCALLFVNTFSESSDAVATLESHSVSKTHHEA